MMTQRTWDHAQHKLWVMITASIIGVGIVSSGAGVIFAEGGDGGGGDRGNGPTVGGRSGCYASCHHSMPPKSTVPKPNPFPASGPSLQDLRDAAGGNGGGNGGSGEGAGGTGGGNHGSGRQP